MFFLVLSIFFNSISQVQQSETLSEPLILSGVTNFYSYEFDQRRNSLDSLKLRQIRRIKVQKSDYLQSFHKSYVVPEDQDIDYVAHVRGLMLPYELYWDSTQIESSFPQNPPTFRQRFEIDNKLIKAGDHTFTLKVARSDIALDDVRIWISEKHNFDSFYGKVNYRDLFFVGVFCLATLFFLGLFYGAGRNRAYLIMALHSFLFMAEVAFNFYSRLYTSSSPILYYVKDIITVISVLQITTINGFIIVLYRLPWRWQFFLAAFIVAVLQSVFGVLYILPFFTTGLLLMAYRRGNPGAALLLIGWATLMILEYIIILPPPFSGYYIGLLVFQLSLVASVSKFIHRKTEQARQIELHHAELEADLLKSKIQPHFLMNTLTSIISWIELKPKVAVKLVKALSEEFRQIRAVSEKDLIDLSTEIELCKTHLDVMSLRTQSKLKLRLNFEPNGQQVPPLLFHTLIENGLTHSVLSGEESEFYIDRTVSEDQQKYTIKNKASIMDEENQSEVKEGFGLTYIRKRLEHSFPKNWNLNYKTENGFWLVDITLPRGGN